MKNMPKAWLQPAQTDVLTERKKEIISVKDKIGAIKGAEIIDCQVQGLEDFDFFSINVKDEEAWLSDEEGLKLAEIFGELVYNRFETAEGSPRFNKDDEEMRAAAYEYVRENVGFAQKVFVLSDKTKDKLIGFLAENYWQDKEGDNVAFVNLLMVNEEYEGKNYAKELLKMVFKQNDIKAVLGASLVPQAVRNGLQVAEEMGYSGFFCGEKVSGGPAGVEEMAKVKELSQLMIDNYKEWEYFDSERQEDGFVVVTPENAMYPCREDQLDFSPNDPLGKIFRNKLLPKQAVADGTVYGTAIALKKQVVENK